MKKLVLLLLCLGLIGCCDSPELNYTITRTKFVGNNKESEVLKVKGSNLSTNGNCVTVWKGPDYAKVTAAVVCSDWGGVTVTSEVDEVKTEKK